MLSSLSDEVVYTNLRKFVLDVTYIYNETRILSSPVGVLIAFEIAPMSEEPLFIWALDHRGQLHRILYFRNDYTTEAESMLIITVSHPPAKNGYEIESAQLNNHTMFVVDQTPIEVHAPDQCSLYLNCGDCLNPSLMTRSAVSCAWQNAFPRPM